MEQAIGVHREYEAATAVIQKLRHERRNDGPEWDEAIARQQAAPTAWAALTETTSNLSLSVERLGVSSEEKKLDGLAITNLSLMLRKSRKDRPIVVSKLKI